MEIRLAHNDHHESDASDTISGPTTLDIRSDRHTMATMTMAAMSAMRSVDLRQRGTAAVHIHDSGDNGTIYSPTTNSLRHALTSYTDFNGIIFFKKC